MNDDQTFIVELLGSPKNDAPRRDYESWLRNQGDPRAAEYLRFEMAWAKAPDRAATTLLMDMAKPLDRVWVARVSRPPMGVFADHVRFGESSSSRPSLSAAHLDWFETRFNLQLPADYRAFLLNYNGGAPEPSHLRIPGREYGPWCYDQVNYLATFWAAKDSEIDRDDDLVWRQQFLHDVRTDQKTFREESHRWASEPHRDWMYIGGGPPTGELEWFCLGCRDGDFNTVYFAAPYLMSAEEEDYCPVAPTFAAFLGMLTDYDPDHLKAIKAGDTATLGRWLQNGGDANELYHNTTLLAHAIFARQPNCARELLAGGAKVFDSHHDYARGSGSRELVDLFASLRMLPPE